MGKGLLIVLAGFIASALIVNQSSQQSTHTTSSVVSAYENELLARQIATSAINLGVAEAKRDFSNAEMISYVDHAFLGGHFDLTATPLAGGEILLRATGISGDKGYEITATLRSIVAPGTVEAAILIDAPYAEISFNGDSFVDSGIDTTPPSMGGPYAGSSVAVHGVRTTLSSVKDLVEGAISHKQEDQIVGIGGELDVTYGPFALNLDSLRTEVLSRADAVFPGGIFNGNRTYGSPTEPQYIVVSGDATFNGTVAGYGVLLIEGDMQVLSGTFGWEGIVMARAGDSADLHITYKGTATIYGALILQVPSFAGDNEADQDTGEGGDPLEGDPSPPRLHFVQDGRSGVYYSYAALDRLSVQLSSIGAAAAPRIVMSGRYESRTGY
ncbi:MAG: hypothetical protein SH809_08650 [Rhodothermales bacterium]|nr:hypothetical protein [Rhodothermales bacterium]